MLCSVYRQACHTSRRGPFSRAVRSRVVVARDPAVAQPNQRFNGLLHVPTQSSQHGKVTVDVCETHLPQPASFGLVVDLIRLRRVNRLAKNARRFIPPIRRRRPVSFTFLLLLPLALHLTMLCQVVFGGLLSDPGRMRHGED